MTRDEDRLPGRGLIVAALLVSGAVVVVASSQIDGPAARAAAIGIAVLAIGAGFIGLRSVGRVDREAEAERRRSQGTLAERADTLSEEVVTRDRVLSAMSEGVVLFSPDGQVAYANRASRSILGRRFDAAAELTPAVLRETVRAVQVDDERAQGQAEPRSVQFETADALIEAVVVPSEPQGTAVLVVSDVTAARRVERLRRDFVANASHELKTPVASILALAETLRRASPGDPEAVERFIARLELEANRLSRLVGDLLELSRLEGQAREAENLRLDQVVAREAERLRARAESAGLLFVIDRSAEVVVRGSARDIALLVHNLIDNAIRYTPEGGRIEVAVAREEGSAAISVEDTGIGIPARDLDRVFERFYRVDAARSRETGGTGLGLAIVRHVAESHGGTVEVRSVLGAGSTFTARLPFGERDEQDLRPR